MRRLAAALLLLAALLGGCSSRPGWALGQPRDLAPRVERPGYREALDRSTRYRSGYDGFDQRFFLAATLQTPAFRRQRVAATADFLRLSAEETAALLEEERQEAAAWVEFFVGFYTAETEWNDLASRDSIWTVSLLLPDGSSVGPSSVRRVHRPDANTLALYPYVDRFWEAYRIRFPAPAPLRPGDEIRLRLASSIGEAVLSWRVEAEDLDL